ncbi:MAG: hypothetical protein EPO06_03575 [Burkholderiaceae bacterium]|nr:MAG: hypothetical protein EPO06_03575 [Burkholderiaceae bacterium]
MSNGHMDQAAGLRSLMTPVLPQSRVIVAAHEAVTPDETLVHTMLAAAQAGHHLALLDGTRGVLGRLLNLPVRYELIHLLEGEKRFDEVMQPAAALEHLQYLPACRGLRALGQVQGGMRNLLQGFALMPNKPDFVVAYGGPDMIESLAELADLAGEMVWRITARPEVITATYAQLKAVVRRYPSMQHRIWVHGLPDATAADHLFANLAEATQKFCGLNLHYLGFTRACPASGRTRSGVPGDAIARLAEAMFRSDSEVWQAHQTLTPDSQNIAEIAL